MEAAGYRVAMARGLSLLERVAEDLLSSGLSPVDERDVVADRELIREAVRREHQRNARRRRLVTRRS